ncbi:hypothetical protein [Sphingopyxis flava]|uniref:Uncharacterized protein n=1 Tax=Sphingopyxis flava TaxID=1507287 RepID=A0A1T5AL85_9SPHN|nr:hypothetical protein [Sphingopyxis flava]SKB35772.1 hypothetical protein SAMN06295937_100413 [Sphingopyxis flava]
MLRCQRQSQIVLADIDQVSEPLQKTEHNENVGKRSDGNAWITPFKAGNGAWRGAALGRACNRKLRIVRILGRKVPSGASLLLTVLPMIPTIKTNTVRPRDRQQRWNSQAD